MFHHGLTPAVSKNLRIERTIDLCTSFLGCGRWNTARTSPKATLTLDPLPSDSSASSAPKSAIMSCHAIFVLVGSSKSTSSLLWWFFSHKFMISLIDIMFNRLYDTKERCMLTAAIWAAPHGYIRYQFALRPGLLDRVVSWRPIHIERSINAIRSQSRTHKTAPSTHLKECRNLRRFGRWPYSCVARHKWIVPCRIRLRNRSPLTTE